MMFPKFSGFRITDPAVVPLSSFLGNQRGRQGLLLIGTAFLWGTTLLWPGMAQTSLDASLTGDQASPSVPALPSNLSVIYVDAANGSDTSGDGSRNAPFQTITYGLTRAGAGVIVQLLPGEYTEASGETFPIELPKGVILRGDEASLGEGYLISGGGTFISPTLARQNITLLAQPGSQVRGVTMRNEGRRGYALWLESSDASVYNNSFVGSIHDGIFMTGASAPQVQGNRFYKNGANGISILGTSTPTIVNNLFQETGFGIMIDQRSAPVVRDNRILQNRSGVIVGGSAQPILRGNLIGRNLEAGLVAISQGAPNLGTPEDPGNNTFDGNGQLDIHNSTRGLSLVAFGNSLSGENKGDIRVSGQAIAQAAAAAPQAVAEGSLSLPETPIQSAPATPPPAAASPAPLAATLPPPAPPAPTPQTPLPTPIPPRLTTSAPVSSPSAPGNTSSGDVLEFRAVPFTADPESPTPSAAEPPNTTSSPETPAAAPQKPLMDITTLLPPPNRRSAPPPQPTQVTASAPPPATTPEAAPAAPTTASQPLASNSNGAQFRVLVIPDASDNLQQLQQLVPTAAETVFNGRNVWQVGLYNSRSSAQSILDQLLDAGFEAMAEMIFSAN
ncbi:MAG: DUF1565 domain-containing protein [Synechococcaceae cyanobacterium SM2_3_1]|nr:DUF1565 domain-containing protein [Synechococcaceae cyanobacterium SM2_3_1]